MDRRTDGRMDGHEEVTTVGPQGIRRRTDEETDEQEVVSMEGRGISKLQTDE